MALSVSVSAASAGFRGGHCPNPSQLRVEVCSERSLGPVWGAGSRAAVRLVGEDAGQVAVGEPAVAGAPLERVVDRPGAVELGQVDRFGHLAPDPGQFPRLRRA